MAATVGFLVSRLIKLTSIRSMLQHFIFTMLSLGMMVISVNSKGFLKNAPSRKARPFEVNKALG